MKALADITAKYIGRPFTDYGCAEFVYQFLDDLGLDPPRGADGLTVDNYKAMVDEDIKAAQRKMLKSFRLIGRKSNNQYPHIGDLLIIEQDNDVFFPAVYVGAGQAIASFIRQGISVFRIDSKNRVILARSLG